MIDNRFDPAPLMSKTARYIVGGLSVTDVCFFEEDEC